MTLTTTASRSILGSRHRFWLRTPNAGEVRISCSRPSSRTGRRPASRSIKPGEITIRPSRTLAKFAPPSRSAIAPGGTTGLFPLAPLLRSGNRRAHDAGPRSMGQDTRAERSPGTGKRNRPLAVAGYSKKGRGPQEGFPGTGGSVSKTCREPREHPTSKTGKPRSPPPRSRSPIMIT